MHDFMKQLMDDAVTLSWNAEANAKAGIQETSSSTESDFFDEADKIHNDDVTAELEYDNFMAHHTTVKGKTVGRLTSKRRHKRYERLPMPEISDRTKEQFPYSKRGRISCKAEAKDIRSNRKNRESSFLEAYCTPNNKLNREEGKKEISKQLNELASC